jgi:nicotinamide-nucleotide amidase
MADDALMVLAAELVAILTQHGRMIALAESCTGGMAAQYVTAVRGSSACFERGFVTYSNAAKTELLDVPSPMLAQHGAVSEAVARAMAQGALAHSHAHFAAAITGIAGPDGGSPEKPVGTVCFAWAGTDAAVHSETRHFTGDRDAVRRKSAETALRGLLVLARAS